MTNDDDASSPGERYFRHPGDVVRLVVWGIALLLLVAFVERAQGTDAGVTGDLADLAVRIPELIRQIALALAQIAVLAVPVVVVVVLAWQRRWRRVAMTAVAAAAGAGTTALADAAFDLSGQVRGAIPTETWLASPTFPPLALVGALAAAAAVGKPWLSRPWRRAADIGLGAVLVTMVVAGSAGPARLAVVLAVGVATGAVVLAAVGAPNRRPTPMQVAATLRGGGIDVATMTLVRATGGRAQLYDVETTGGDRLFAKVYSRDTRDADLLYRGYRSLTLRESGQDRPMTSLDHAVEHEALLLVLTGDAGVTVPELSCIAAMEDGSMVLAMRRVDGRRLDALAPDEIDGDLLAAVWHEVSTMHGARVAHRALRAANILVTDGRPTIIDFGFAQASAGERLRAADRAELVASLATLVPPDQAIAAAAGALAPDDLAAAAPFLQPLALTAATRKRTSKSKLGELRSGIETATGTEPAPLEQLVRVRPRTIIMVATFAAAFYVLLPQLANVGDSFTAMRSANWGWFGLCIVTSLVTYLFSAIALAGSVPGALPFGATVEAQVASSFVNRVTPANVGGMALNVRFMQKTGIEAGAAVTGLGLNVVVGAVVHILLLVVFLAFSSASGSGGFALPSGSKLLVGIAVVLAVSGLVGATSWGRRLFRKHVLRHLKDSASSLRELARSPRKLLGLFGGSAGVTLAYIASLAAAVAAFRGDVSVGDVGAVYLGASIIAAAAPTPGGLGAMEAALVAGLTGVGMKPGVAVAAVLGYRLATYWLPVLPGWLSFRRLERRNFI